jgi:hypothetical protein
MQERNLPRNLAKELLRKVVAQCRDRDVRHYFRVLQQTKLAFVPQVPTYTPQQYDGANICYN